MGKAFISSPRETGKKTDLFRREYVIGTRILELGGGKRICAKKKLQVDFEGYALPDVDILKADEVEGMLYGDLQYAQYCSLIGSSYTVEEKAISDRIPLAVQTRRTRRITSAAPSRLNAFLALTALVTSICAALGLPLKSAAVTGVVGSLALTGAIHRFLERNRLNRSR